MPTARVRPNCFCTVLDGSQYVSMLPSAFCYALLPSPTRKGHRKTKKKTGTSHEIPVCLVGAEYVSAEAEASFVPDECVLRELVLRVGSDRYQTLRGDHLHLAHPTRQGAILPPWWHR